MVWAGDRPATAKKTATVEMVERMVSEGFELDNSGVC